ncbi:MAG: hypothetical protein HYT63_03075 [Candidatus Yanofskybacteria bacterium]|nr:hypothetical protein [Candidatus Yanofskybacteria bacterium]
MLSILEVKKLMESPDMPDREAEAIRDTCQGLVEFALEVVKNKKFKVDNPELFAERK